VDRRQRQMCIRDSQNPVGEVNRNGGKEKISSK
jgi:hypothetical protein